MASSSHRNSPLPQPPMCHSMLCFQADHSGALLRVPWNVCRSRRATCCWMGTWSAELLTLAMPSCTRHSCARQRRGGSPSLQTPAPTSTWCGGNDCTCSMFNGACSGAGRWRLAPAACVRCPALLEVAGRPLQHNVLGLAMGCLGMGWPPLAWRLILAGPHLGGAVGEGALCCLILQCMHQLGCIHSAGQHVTLPEPSASLP